MADFSTSFFASLLGGVLSDIIAHYLIKWLERLGNRM